MVQDQVARLEWKGTEVEWVLTTEDLTKIFGVLPGTHPVVFDLTGFENASSSQEALDVVIDPEKNVGLVGGESGNWVNTGDTVAGRSNKKSYQLVIDSSDTFKDMERKTFDVWNEIVIRKTTNADWTFWFTYQLALGGMMWYDEWAELLADKRQPDGGYLTSAGGAYHQVGDYYQIGRREYG